jgi:tripartite-type tricarboxylate transporter receptor subunit TctC
MPDVPAIAESLPGYEFTCWMGLLVPVKVSRPIVERIQRDVVAIVHSSDVTQKLALDAAEAVGSTPAEFSAFLKAEIARWSSVVKAAGIRAD